MCRGDGVGGSRGVRAHWHRGRAGCGTSGRQILGLRCARAGAAALNRPMATGESVKGSSAVHDTEMLVVSNDKELEAPCAQARFSKIFQSFQLY